MAIPQKSGNIDINESGTLPDLPPKMKEQTDTANWWFEARSVLDRQRDSIEDRVRPANISFTLSSDTPHVYEYTHNLGKMPLVQVLDGDNEVSIGATLQITHDSVNKFTVSSASPLTGTLIIH